MGRTPGPAWTEHDAQEVRPYAVSGGRTRPRHTIRLVSLLAPGSSLPAERLPPEAEKALSLCCREPRSVAEIAAHIRLPVQVTKVILSDLLDAGVLAMAVCDTAADPEAHALEKILVALRRKFPDADAA